MVFHLLNEKGKSIKWAEVPLQFADWVAVAFPGQFTQFLGSINPYRDVLIAPDVITVALPSLRLILEELKRHRPSCIPPPRTVELWGDFGTRGATVVVSNLLELFEAYDEKTSKVISIGD